jgi:hypothetical protein
MGRCVEAGEGRSGYPMPAIGIHGLLAGIVLADENGYAAAVRSRVASVPAAFRRAARMQAETASAYLQELERCVERGDHLLFHSLAVDAIRAGFIASFAAGDRYWPPEKRLSQRLQLLGHPDLAELERRAWLGETLGREFVLRRPFGSAQDYVRSRRARPIFASAMP